MRLRDADARQDHFITFVLVSHEISIRGTIRNVLHGILLARHLQEHDDTAGFHFRRSGTKYDQAVVRGTRSYIVGNARTRQRVCVNRRGLIMDRICDESESYHSDPAHVARVLCRDVDTLINSLRNRARIASLINANVELRVWNRLWLALRIIADNFRTTELSQRNVLFLVRYSFISRRFNGRKEKY